MRAVPRGGRRGGSHDLPDIQRRNSQAAGGAAQSGPVYRWQEGGARHLLQRYSAAGKTPQFTCAVTRGARTDVTFAESYRAGASVRAVLEAAGLFDIFADAGMLVLHSSYIVDAHGGGNSCSPARAALARVRRPRFGSALPVRGQSTETGGSSARPRVRSAGYSTPGHPASART